MEQFTGKGVYGAIAIGKISVFKRKDAIVKRSKISDKEAELERLKKAKDKALLQLDHIYEKALVEVGETNARIFEVHKMMLEDEDYLNAITEMIKNQSINAEYAVATTGENFASMFASMDDSYMQARAADIKDISNRLIDCLAQNNENFNVGTDPDRETGLIICADDLAPSETVALDKEKVVAFVTAYGSSNSHTAILARNMNIPAIIGLGKEFLTGIKDGETAIADGFTGTLIINPDETTKKDYAHRREAEEEKKILLQNLRGKENITLDGTKINIYANIGSPDNIGAVLLNDADGIGLFRSEFIYLENTDFPTEAYQFNIYKKILESMGGKKVIIRTMDIGADKHAPYFNLPQEENPALGFRAIRICLTQPEIFKTQLRALFRASAYGNLGIMFPMITSVTEVKRILEICHQVKCELSFENLPYSEETELGIMIETPAAAIISEGLSPLVDFFSIGTNDLTQYTLACDRQNPMLEEFCDTHHPAILKLIEITVKNAHKHNTWVGICGELAADTSLTETFLKIGVDELSVSPGFVLKVREKVRSIDLTKKA